jgi:uncharacterized membrane protein
MIWFLLFWVSCGVLNHGLYFSYQQKNWPSIAKEHYSYQIRSSLFVSIFGPMALISLIVFISSHGGFKGFKLY